MIDDQAAKNNNNQSLPKIHNRFNFFLSLISLVHRLFTRQLMVVGTLSLSLSSFLGLLLLLVFHFPMTVRVVTAVCHRAPVLGPPFGHNNTASQRERGKWEENISCPAARRARKSERE